MLMNTSMNIRAQSVAHDLPLLRHMHVMRFRKTDVPRD